jgi:GNAT superfamily N-acetyltransferase
MRVRLATPSDLPGLMRLKAAAGWNQTEDDWLRLLRLQPDGCFVMEADGVAAASTTALTYPGDLAWIGMVLTLPEYRGRGFARKLMHVALEFCGARTIRLDASDMGQSLYESLGFRIECAVERWFRPPGPCPELRAGKLSFNPALDREVFGADRSALVSELMMYDGASIDGEAYAFGRPGSNAAYFGPCVSRADEASRALLHWFAWRHHRETACLDLFPHAGRSAEIAGSLGFAPVRRLMRMVRLPAAPAAPDPRIFAIAGFEYG